MRNGILSVLAIQSRSQAATEYEKIHMWQFRRAKWRVVRETDRVTKWNPAQTGRVPDHTETRCCSLPQKIKRDWVGGCGGGGLRGERTFSPALSFLHSATKWIWKEWEKLLGLYLQYSQVETTAAPHEHWEHIYCNPVTKTCWDHFTPDSIGWSPKTYIIQHNIQHCTPPCNRQLPHEGKHGPTCEGKQAQWILKTAIMFKNDPSSTGEKAHNAPELVNHLAYWPLEVGSLSLCLFSVYFAEGLMLDPLWLPEYWQKGSARL